MVVRKERARHEIGSSNPRWSKVCIFRKKMVPRHYRACGVGWLSGILFYFFILNFLILFIFFVFWTWIYRGGSRHDRSLKIIFRSGCITRPKNNILAVKTRSRMRSLPLKIGFYLPLQMVFVVVAYDFKLIRKDCWCIHLVWVSIWKLNCF